MKLSKPACWVLAGSGFLTSQVVRFQPLLPLGKNTFPAPMCPRREAGMLGPNTCLSDGILPRTGLPLALSPLSFLLSLREDLTPCVGCYAPGGFRPLQNSQAHSGPFGSTCWRCTVRRAGAGVWMGLSFPLGVAFLGPCSPRLWLISWAQGTPRLDS